MDATQEVKKTGIEILKEMDPVDRIIFIVGSLDKLARHHREAAGGMIAATRSQADEKIRSRGKGEAYMDVVRLIMTVFRKEIMEHQQKAKEEACQVQP